MDATIAQRDSLGARPATRTSALPCAVLFLGFLAVFLPLRSDYPVNWDAVQFALGVENFDVVRHQPHPPGYIGYIGLARVVNAIVGDPHSALTLIAAVSGAIVPAAFFLFARRFLDHLPALCCAVALGASMLVAYNSLVALTYIVELALVLPFALFCHRALHQPGRHDLFVATALLATIGSVRQTALVLLLPLWIYVLWRTPWSRRIQAGALLTIGVLVWLIPLLWLSGGPAPYLQASRDLAAITGGNTSILSMRPAGVAQNTAFVIAGLAIGVNVGAVIIIAGRQAILSAYKSMSTKDRTFFALWSLPALAVYILAHTGQMGYILVLLPIPFLALGVAITRAAERASRHMPALSSATASLTLTSLFVVVNIVGLVSLPVAVNLALADSVRMNLRQFDLAASDDHWEDLTATIQHYPPEGSVILTTIGGPRVSGSFRHLTYLLPEYRVYGLGRDLDNGVFGPLFIAYNGESDYEVAGMRGAESRLELPPDTRYLLIPDPEIAGRIDVALEDRPAWIDRRGGVTVAVIEPGTLLAFSIRGEHITFSECQKPGCEARPQPAR